MLRDSLKEQDVLPLKEGEALVLHRHRYLKDAEQQAPRHVVVRATPFVALDLADEPQVAKEEGGGLRIRLKLRPKPAAALERMTKAQQGGQVAIVFGGEVVTMHKVREVIKAGEVQITSCAPGAAEYLLEQLQAKRKAR